MLDSRLRQAFEALLNPYFICLFLIGLIIYLSFHNNNCKLRHYLWVPFLGLLVCSTGWLPHFLTHRLEDRYTTVVKVAGQIHWIVVLGGGHANLDVPANDNLSSVSLDRLVEGIRLYRQLPAAKLILSGGGLTPATSEATYLSEVAKWFSIPKDHIILELDSVNTADQAVEIKKIVQNEPFYLVTSAIHMSRAMGLCRQQGLNPIAAPADFTLHWSDGRWERMLIPSPYNLTYTTIALHELLGVTWAKIRGLL